MPAPPPPPAPAYVYTDQYLKFDYGDYHPLRIWRLGLAHELIRQLGMDQPAFVPAPASREDLASFHDRHYLETLEELSRAPEKEAYLAFGLGAEDNPVFPGLYDWSTLLAGGTLMATRLVAREGYPAAFSMAGGMHHALAGRASGFCYINDLVLGIKELLAQGKRVAYVDIDAHHGDGVQWAFYGSDQVLTISLHQHPATLFPGTGSLEEMGRGEGKGYSVNLPLWPDTDDDIYVRCFDEIVPPLIEAFQPDYIMTQLGVDTFLSDPLANLNLTTRGFAHCVRTLRDIATGRWIALGGGGYHVVNVARAWALAWAIMLGRENEVPEELPQEWCARFKIPADERRLLDHPDKIRGRSYYRATADAEDAVAFIRYNIFPLVGAKPI